MDRTRGYTLLELMMVVVLIGISVAIALPTMSGAVGEDKQHEAAMQVVSVFRTARNTAMRLGTPTLVLTAPGGQFWIIPAPRQIGVTNACGSVDWPAVAVPLPVPELDLPAGRGPDAQDFAFDRFGVTAAFNVAVPAVCYSPLGRVYLSTTGVAGPFDDTQGAAPGGALVVFVSRGASQRKVIIPMGSGMPRFGI